MKKNIFIIITLYLLGNISLFADDLAPEEINDLAIHSEDSELILGLTGGTLGFGLNVAHPINDFMSVRFNINKFNIDTTDNSRYSNILSNNKKYNLDTKGLLLDVHLLQFRLTGGIYLNNNSLRYRTKPKAGQGIILNGQEFGLDKVVKIDSTVTGNEIAPYIGVGWGNNRSNEGWNFSLDIGLMYHGKPKIDIDLEMIKGIPVMTQNAINAAFEIEKRKQERDLSNLSFYPVIMVGMSYNF